MQCNEGLRLFKKISVQCTQLQYVWHIQVKMKTEEQNIFPGHDSCYSQKDRLVLVQRAFQIYSLLKKSHSNAEYRSMDDLFLNRGSIGIPTCQGRKKWIEYFSTVVENRGISRKILFSSNFCHHCLSLITLPSKEGCRSGIGLYPQHL